MSIDLADDSLRAFEADVCDADAKGCWIHIEKHVPKEDDAAGGAPAGKKPPPAKGKGPAAGGEELKPAYSKAWVDLKPLLHPGAKTLTQRCLLQPVHPSEKVGTSTGMSQTQAVAQASNDALSQEGTAVEDIYQPAQTYIYLTLSLNEPLYPECTQEAGDTSALTAKFKEPKKFPSTKDAIATYESAIMYIVSQVGQEYAKKVQEEEQGTSTNKNQPQKTQTFTSMNPEVQAEQRRERFLTDFTQSYKYTEIRTRLQEAIFRLGVEKFKKQVGGGKQLDAAAKNKFKAELYIFLQKKLKECLHQAMQEQDLPLDISSQYKNLEKEKNLSIQSSFTEEQEAKHSRLAEEFDVIQDVECAEREYVNNLLDDPNNKEKWYEFALFSLKFGMQAKAEQYLDRVIKLSSMTQEMHLMLAAMMLQRQNFQKTKMHLDAVLDEDWTNVHANLLFGFYYKLTKWDEMARKHFAIAKVKRMRDLQVLPPKSSIPKNFRTEQMEYKVEIVDWQKQKTSDESLSAKESDIMFFDLIDFLLKR